MLLLHTLVMTPRKSKLRNPKCKRCAINLGFFPASSPDFGVILSNFPVIHFAKVSVLKLTHNDELLPQLVEGIS